jgi:hypothetical protein
MTLSREWADTWARPPGAVALPHPDIEAPAPPDPITINGPTSHSAGRTND